MLCPRQKAAGLPQWKCRAIGREPRKVFDHPASLEIARILGYENLIEAEILALDPGRNTSRLAALGQELVGVYYPGRFIGDHVTLCIRASELRVKGGTGPNCLPLKLLQVSDRDPSHLH